MVPQVSKCSRPMIRSTKCWIRTDATGGMIRRGMPGLTLVELMIYLAILSLLSVGIMQMILEVQTSNITILGQADNFAKGDIALRRVQVKLGDSDDVSVEDLRASSGDRACLRLKSYEQYPRTGYRFDGRNQFLRTSDAMSNHVPIIGSAARTVSVWVRVDPDQAGRGTVVMWGNGTKSQFGLDIVVHQNAGRTIAEPVLNFGCATMVPSQLKDLRDGTWHHVAVTFGGTGSNGLANTAKLYVDGVAVPMAFVACPGSPGIGVSTGKSPLYVGRDIADRQSGLKGLVSDLRIWDRQLGGPEIKELAGREPGAGQNIAGLQISLPLDSYSTSGTVNRGAWPIGRTAALFNAGGRSPIVQTLVDATNFHSFCFLDIDNDGLYELWESKTSKTLPPLPLGTAAQLNAQGWQSRSDDMFVPGQSGFFKVVGRAPESVIANFAIGKGVLRQENRQQKTESKALASTRVKKRPALCAITSEPKLATPACRLGAAFIAIDGYIPGLHGELDMEHVRWRDVGGTKTASELPNMPTGATATWYPALGVMKFTSPQPLETRI